MNTEYGYIILRDIPKKEARLDLVFSEIEGGFRGFKEVPPGPHYASVLLGGVHKGFWCYLQPGEVIVKVFNSSSLEFEDDNPDSTARYQQMARGGAMERALLGYVKSGWSIWKELIYAIKPDNFPPTLHQPETGGSAGSLFSESSSGALNDGQTTLYEKVLVETHNGDVNAFLEEFQFAYMRWFVESQDLEASKRWHALLKAIYSANQHDISHFSEFFVKFSYLLMWHLKCWKWELLNDNREKPENFVFTEGISLTEKMRSSDIERVDRAGWELQKCLEKCQLEEYWSSSYLY